MTDALPLALTTWENGGLLEAVTKKIRIREQPRARKNPFTRFNCTDGIWNRVARRNNLDLQSESIENVVSIASWLTVAGRYIMDPPTRTST